MVRRYSYLLQILFFSMFVSFSSGEIGFNPYATIKQEYDDNIFYSAEDETEDVLTTLSYGVGIYDQSERFDVSASAGFELSDYSENPDLGGTDSQMGVSVFSRFTEKLSVTVLTDYSVDSKKDRDFEETGMVDDDGRQVTEQDVNRVVQTRVNSELSTVYTLSEITTADLSYKFIQTNYDEQTFADYYSHNAGIGMVRNISYIIPETKADIGVNYFRYESVDFSDPEVNSGISEQTDLVLNSYSVVVGLDCSLSDTLDVRLHLGERYTDSRSTTGNVVGEQSEERNDGWGTIGTLNLRYKGEYTNCYLSLTHDIKPRSGTGGALNNTASVFSIKHRLTEKIRFGLSAGYYLSRSDDALSSEEVDEYAMRIRPDFEYAISKQISLEGFYSFRSVVDVSTSEERERNLFMVRVSYRYPSNKK